MKLNKKKFRVRKHMKYSLLNKRFNVMGRISTIMALLSFVLLFGAVAMSYAFKGSAGMAVAYLGAGSFFVAIIGAITGLQGFRDKDHKMFYCWVGSLANITVFLFISGMMLAFS